MGAKVLSREKRGLLGFENIHVSVPPCLLGLELEHRNAQLAESGFCPWSFDRRWCGLECPPVSLFGIFKKTLSPAGSRLPVETPSQRDPAAAHEERECCYIWGFCFYETWGVIT